MRPKTRLLTALALALAFGSMTGCQNSSPSMPVTPMPDAGPPGAGPQAPSAPPGNPAGNPSGPPSVRPGAPPPGGG